MTPTPLAVDAAGAAAICGFRSAATVRMLYRNGSFPAPIDPDLNARLWRWSVRVIRDYVEGGAA